MIDIKKAEIAFQEFLERYKDQSIPGFELKIIHTYHVLENSKIIAESLNLSEEDINLSCIIALLHDIGRFEELNYLKTFDDVGFDHASYGVKMLFDKGLIRLFLEDSKYDNIIKIAIDNHSRLKIEEGLNDRSLMHSRIIRDADKLDNFRVNSIDSPEIIFPEVINNIKDIEESTISDSVYNSVINNQCVNIKDRKTPLDYWICSLAFVFDLNYEKSFEIIKEKDYINYLIDRFNYSNNETKVKMEVIKNIINNYIEKRINYGINRNSR